MILILIVLYFLYKPIPLQGLYNRYFFPTSVFTEGAYTDEGVFTYKNSKFNTYLLRNEGAKSLVVWFHGGCFMQNHPHIVLPFLGLLRRNLPDCDILTFDYPVPYTHTLHDTLKFSNSLIKATISEQYENYFLGGDSAGSFFALLTSNIETSNTMSGVLGIPKLGIQYRGFISVCGFYDQTFDNNKIADALFKFYIARGVEQWSTYRVQEIFIPTIVFTSKSDFLYSQNINFVRQNIARSVYLKEFDTHNAIHSYITNTSAEETLETVEYIREFVDRNSR